MSSATRGGTSFFAFQDIITGTIGFIIVIAVFLALSLDRVIHISTDPDSPLADESRLQALHEQIAELRRQLPNPRDASPSEDLPALRRMVESLKASIAALTRAKPTAEDDTSAASRMIDREILIERQKLEAELEDLRKRIQAESVAEIEQGARARELESAVKEAQSQLVSMQDRKNVLRLIPDRANTSKEPVVVVVTDDQLRVHRFDRAETFTLDVGSALEAYLKELSPLNYYVVLYFKPTGAGSFRIMTNKVRSMGFEIGYDLIPEEIEFDFGSEPKGGQ
jgi:hypothetical protein